MRQPTVRVYKGGGWLRVDTNPPKRDPAKRNTGSQIPVVPEKLISPHSTHTQTKYQYAGQLLTNNKPRQGKDTKGLYTTYYLEETSVIQ